MNNLLIGLLGALLATNQPAAVSNLVQETTGITIKVPDKDDPVEQEYEKILHEDDAAEKDADKWIKDAEAVKAAGGIPSPTLGLRIEERYKKVRKLYEDFLTEHPQHIEARLAFGSFLMDVHDEAEGEKQWIKVTELDPKNPAGWNNLANHYGHRGPVKKSFDYYQRAIALNPKEPVYLQNMATTVYLFRKDAKEYWDITEEQVFNKALDLYRQAQQLLPNSLALATDIAQSYYGIKPFRLQPALDAWNYALKLAATNVEKEGIYLHLARVELNAGMFDEARKHLDMVSNPEMQELKTRLEKNLRKKLEEKGGTNAPTSATSKEPLPATAETQK